ncbi:TonB-dependent receptor domain-containing protein [Chitinophaga pinensis]|uniref:TonB-dependent receptor n=1 Tax=Chitinophaga pinensis (strain ATCC 43595 / DSM 2588 / LMG 13176 / NBRC 15968 / NCIMB 11800 / UQM 2034) TaxID=485918 RepID=A0A979G6N1_CHIPD|nr:TonB-dependent receptor [Chitinophaga pinensis]ACU61592.1 TonB-dependent receptor [Chitinophaga pinensis DSM 2588]
MTRYLIIVSGFVSVGVYGQDASNIQKDTTVKILSEVTVSASRTRESLLRSPVSIQKAGEQYFRMSAAPSFYDALEHLQGVQLITPSLGFKVLNARGFANTTNVRFAQLVDGMDVASPHIGGPIANALGPSDLDVTNVEILPGVASALYGMNTVNGLANISTKNPFTSEGLSIQQKTALTHLSDANSAVKAYTETSIRWAKVISPKLAFKINGTFNQGYDWVANDHRELNGQANASTGLLGKDNPARDPLSSYGNESSDRRTISLGGRNYVVARTGYDEKDVVDYDLRNIKADAGIYYQLKPGMTLTYLYHIALLDNVYQRANRFRLEDYLVQQHGIQFQSSSLQLKVYLNRENTGNSYNLRSMAENIDRNYKPDNQWYADYTAAFNTATGAGATVADAHRQGRVAADAGRPLPGTEAFSNSLTKLAQINNWDIGAALKVKASFIHAEGQVDLTQDLLSSLKEKAGLQILVGSDHRTYIIEPDGNYFINPEAGKEYTNIHYAKTGGFVSVTKTLLNGELKLGAILRGDKNDYFDLMITPRFTAVYSPVNTQHFRASYQSGYRYPSIFEAYSNVNSGGVKRVGGLPAMSQGIFEKAWLASSITTFQQAVLTDVNSAGLTQNQAIEKNKGLLKKNPYTYIKAEHVKSMEIGYKGIFDDGRFFIDAEAYLNKYKNFIAQANMNVPNTGVADSIPYALYNKSKQSPYRMWTNSQTEVNNYGGSLGLTYTEKGYVANANVTYAKLKMSDKEDGLEDGFNTPSWTLNVSLAKERILKHAGAGISWKWQSSYYWQSFLVNGDVDAYSTVEAQVTYLFDKINCKAKLGASNLLNKYYYSFLGGPSIGGMYYLTVTYGIR